MGPAERLFPFTEEGRRRISGNSGEAWTFVKDVLVEDPNKRLEAGELVGHPWLAHGRH